MDDLRVLSSLSTFTDLVRGLSRSQVLLMAWGGQAGLRSGAGYRKLVGIK
jgi:hypothetical protein